MCFINFQIFNIRFVYKTSRHLNFSSQMNYIWLACFAEHNLSLRQRLKHNIILETGITRHLKCNLVPVVPCTVVAGRRAVVIENRFNILTLFRLGGGGGGGGGGGV